MEEDEKEQRNELACCSSTRRIEQKSAARGLLETAKVRRGGRRSANIAAPSGSGPARNCLWKGILLCRYNGKYKCGCGRCWHGMALKIQNIAPSDPGTVIHVKVDADWRNVMFNLSVKLDSLNGFQDSMIRYKPRHIKNIYTSNAEYYNEVCMRLDDDDVVFIQGIQ